MSRRREATRLEFVFLACALSGCGGAVHFVSPAQVAPVPTVPPVDKRVTEKFRYGMPTGSVVNVFEIYARKSMKETRDRLMDTLPSLMTGFWANASGYRDIRFALGRDVEGGDVSWDGPAAPGPDRGQQAALTTLYLRNALAQQPLDLAAGEQERATPFEGMTEVARSLALADAPTVEPTWVHYFYFRDWDLTADAAAAAASEQESFLRGLDRAPLSRFRYSVHVFSHTDPSRTCLPSSRIAGRLAAALSSSRVYPIELCRMLDPSDTDWTAKVMEDVAQLDSRLVLRQVPDLSTVEITVAGEAVARQETEFDADSNEIRFIQERARRLRVGDEVEVRYVPRE